MNIYNGFFKYADLAHITELQAKGLENVVIENQDVLINITGASIARSCVVPSDILPARVNQHVSIPRCKKETLLPTYLNHMLINPSYQLKLLSIGHNNGATREALTKHDLERVLIPVPPLSLQNDFASRISLIEEHRTEMQTDLKQMEELKSALMQEYVG